MAFSNANPSSSKASAHMIFLSFRGDDTRNNYTSLLWKYLGAAGFKVFLDENSIGMGQRIAYEIPNAINKSMGAVIIFSETYAASEWCLDELLLILERKRLLGDRYVLQTVYFGGVQPSDLKELKGSYGEALAEHGNRFPYNRVKAWKEALREVSGLRGKILLGRKWNESMDEIAEEFREKFHIPHVIVDPESKNPSSRAKQRNAPISHSQSRATLEGSAIEGPTPLTSVTQKVVIGDRVSPGETYLSLRTMTAPDGCTQWIFGVHEDTWTEYKRLVEVALAEGRATPHDNGNLPWDAMLWVQVATAGKPKKGNHVLGLSDQGVRLMSLPTSSNHEHSGVASSSTTIGQTQTLDISEVISTILSQLVEERARNVELEWTLREEIASLREERLRETFSASKL